MGFMIFIIGVGGIAGAIELGESPTAAVVVTILGLAILMIESKKFNDNQRKHRR